MYALMMTLMLSHTILTRNVNESKRNLLKPWVLKPGSFGNAQNNTYTYLKNTHTNVVLKSIKNKYVYN